MVICHFCLLGEEQALPSRSSGHNWACFTSRGCVLRRYWDWVLYQPDRRREAFCRQSICFALARLAIKRKLRSKPDPAPVINIWHILSITSPVSANHRSWRDHPIGSEKEEKKKRENPDIKSGTPLGLNNVVNVRRMTPHTDVTIKGHRQRYRREVGG